jgi:biopolymer transport protein ExbD
VSAAPLDDDDEITGINVTPLVDITLVLLIIFMVTTSLISNAEGLQIDKPKAATGVPLPDQSIVLMCDADGSIVVDGDPMPDDNAIIEKITDKLAVNRELQGIVQCDEAAQVGQMVHLIDLLRDSGVKKYAIATRKPDTGKS